MYSFIMKLRVVILFFDFRKHDYETKDDTNQDEMEIDDSESSQELSQGSKVSAADEEVMVDCRVCREPILIDSVHEFTACTEPSGEAHFAAHFVCLGLYPTTSQERKVIKTCTKCPRHRL